MFHLERRFGGKYYIQQCQLRLSGWLHAGVGGLLNTEAKPPINVEYLLWKYLYRQIAQMDASETIATIHFN